MYYYVIQYRKKALLNDFFPNNQTIMLLNWL